MTPIKKKPKVLDCKASDNEYLHKDFHGAMCYSVKYLDEHFGPEAVTEYFQNVARSYFAPLSGQLKREGLKALEKHWTKVFTEEGGKFRLNYEDGTLVLTVEECPAVRHLRKNHQLYTDRYCESTVIVNETICREAGYRCSCRYEAGQGKCVQKFWKNKEGKK